MGWILLWLRDRPRRNFSIYAIRTFEVWRWIFLPVAFGPTRSIQWLQRRDGTYHLMVIDDEGAAPPEGAPRLPLEALANEQPAQLLLVGKRSRGRHFAEGRIPDDIEYPDDTDGEHLAVEIRHYLCNGGAMRVWRCVRIRPAV
jgi:hypothetical protein